MKTAEEKAKAWLKANVRSQHLSLDQRMALEKLLKEQDSESREDQDRITRHACADAVLECPEDVTGEWIKESCAHAACINVKAV